MTNINCTLNCIYQKDGKCTLSYLSQVTKDKSFINQANNSENKLKKVENINCAYYIPVKT
ncbi:hypothetical protein HKI81_09185 [Caldanaerobacter subterraneus]|uniref:Hydroxymyristoyl-ACP dehydratase n=1 Tax=Caldanaerobacter subterraneus TaxID=911092 RepID=A0A7Y2PN63_9THEO|nr:hypothetical protein [Caldanaerobacter subterraneus]